MSANTTVLVAALLLALLSGATSALEAANAADCVACVRAARGAWCMPQPESAPDTGRCVAAGAACPSGFRGARVQHCDSCPGLPVHNGPCEQATCDDCRRIPLGAWCPLVPVRAANATNGYCGIYNQTCPESQLLACPPGMTHSSGLYLFNAFRSFEQAPSRARRSMRLYTFCLPLILLSLVFIFVYSLQNHLTTKNDDNNKNSFTVAQL